LQVSVLGWTASGPIQTRNGLARLGISTLRLSTQGPLMHYFQFNIKDYQSHTGHLDDLEDLAYRRLLDWCYLHERPLPPDPTEVARLIRMRSHTDCIATVLREFFVSTKDGWVSDRVQRELQAVSRKSEKARESAKARWNKGLDANASETHTEGNATHNPLPITQDPDLVVPNGTTRPANAEPEEGVPGLQSPGRDRPLPPTSPCSEPSRGLERDSSRPPTHEVAGGGRGHGQGGKDR